MAQSGVMQVWHGVLVFTFPVKGDLVFVIRRVTCCIANRIQRQEDNTTVSKHTNVCMAPSSCITDGIFSI